MHFATSYIISVQRKSADSDVMLSNHIDILALTETWLSASDTSACLADICLWFFKVYHQYQSFEVIYIYSYKTSISANFICIYRPTASTNNFFS